MPKRQRTIPSPLVAELPPSQPDFCNVAGQEAAKKAITVALVGNHSILLLGPPGCGKTALVSAAGTLNSRLNIGEAWPCPCGYQTDEYRACPCTPREVDRWRRKLRSEHWAMWVQTPCVTTVDLEHWLRRRRHERQNPEISKQVEDAARLLPKVSAIPDQDALSLLRSAKEEFGLSAQEYLTTIVVAGSIAALDERTVISSSDIAEAVNYRPM